MTRDDGQYYNREKLYDEVWKEPMTVVCKRYGVSDAALAKICDTLNLPRPRAGYWTQKECGKAPLRPELPEFDNPPRLLIHPPSPRNISNRKTAIETNRVVKSRPGKSVPNHETDTEHASQVQAADTVPEPPPAQKAFRWQEHVNEKEILFPQAFEEASRLIEKALLPGKAIAVPETTGKEHPYIKKTRKVLERKKINPGKNASRYNQGLIHSFGKELFNVNVGPASVQRALNILKILCAEFEKQGFALVSEPDRYNRNRYDPVCVVIMDQKIAFSLTEDTTKTEIKNKNMYYTEYEYTPTGRLVLQHSLHQPGKYEQRQWNDTEQTPLEKRVPEIMTALILAAAWKRESTAREEERAREEAIEKEKARRSAINKQRIINFRKGVEHWVEYQEMAAFLGVVKEAFEKTDRKNADTKKWIQWAENYLSNYSVISEDMIRYDVEEYRAEKTNSWQKPAPPPEEPYNYWKRPWYQRGVHR